MLNKIILAASLSIITSLSFADATTNATLTIKPIAPETWGYMYSYVILNNEVDIGVGYGNTIDVSVGYHIKLIVHAMNTKVRVNPKCENIDIKTPGPHYLNFKLMPSWIVECSYK